MAKDNISAFDLGKIIWQGTVDYPGMEKFLTAMQFTNPMDVVRDEVVYFLSFETDCAFHCLLNNQPDVQKVARDSYLSRLRDFATARKCKPLPPGDWMEKGQGLQGLRWLPSGPVPADNFQPIVNLQQRFDLYLASLKRCPLDRHGGRAAAFMLAAWCGTTNGLGVFIGSANSWFLTRFEVINKMLDSYEVTV